MQKLRIRYAKRGRLRFTSHRDFGRALERAVRRAGLPVAYSSGFNPHPRISYANAAPTGASSEAEYVEIGVTQQCQPDGVLRSLDAALPPGLDILEVVVASKGALADRLEAGRWSIELAGVEPAAAAAATEDFLARHTVEVQRMTKRGIRTFDCRGAVVSLTVRPEGSATGIGEEPGPTCAILDVVVRHGNPSVRPDDILAGLCETSGLVAAGSPRQTRIAQGPLDAETGSVGDPLDIDRDATA